MILVIGIGLAVRLIASIVIYDARLLVPQQNPEVQFLSAPAGRLMHL
jgi:hypothetical protein